jgi:hypothetical protein
MMIQDERCAASLLVDRDGRRDHLLFDDIGCMLDTERSKGDEFTVIARFVRDHAANMWLAADTAVFLCADRARMATPMGSGAVAFADRAAAEEAQRQFGGEIRDYTTLGAWRLSDHDRRTSR